MRLLHLAGFLAAASLAVSGCKCGGSSGDDAGTDGGGKDAGPISCQTTADCKTAGATDLVCDPQEKVCVAKCAQDSDCTYVASGVCETNEGTCHKPCGEEDFCPAVVPADGGVSLVCREQTGHCVPRCSQDDDCSAIASGSRCVETTGKCVGDAHGCNFDTDCNSYTDFDDYCFNGGIQCRCVIESNDAGTNGVCHRRRRSCSECTSDVQCGNVPQFDPQGACQVVNGDTSGKKYCLFQHSGPCACGYFDNGSGFCAPASGRTCADPGCAEDKDCPGGSVCNAARCACEARCRWDFANKTTAAPGCPIVAGVQTTCWVDNENLDPASIYYGSGRCKPPCMSDNDCKFNSSTNPHGGDKLKCAGEQLAGGGLSDKRCRANGDCMDDLECPVQPDTSIYFGYCDRGSFACKLDCRVGTDPLSSKPYNDCRSPYGCQNGPNDAGICVLKTCVEQGGASIACNTGEYCCGEDKNGDDAGDPCPPPGERDPSGCYKAPKPPFCTSCMSNDDCKSLQAPSWQTNCPPGVVSPSCSPYPILCYPFQDQATMRQVNVCAPATYNDSRRDSFGRGRDTKGCPAGFSAFYQRIKFVNGDDNCTSDAQCQLGGIDAGRCGIDNTVTLRDGGHPLSCLCTVGSATEQCPNQPDAGVTSFCKFGNNGDTQACMQTVSCLPPSPYVFSDAGPPFNGCAL
ncbi:MAG: hypothetical protein IPJ65_24545 [Archangiaceae bacterium]|nr:hypothetical protein [Archangiaceae bacterium]